MDDTDSYDDIETSSNPDVLSDTQYLEESARESSAILDSSDLNPLLCPTCSVGTAATDRIITTFSECGMLEPIAAHTATVAAHQEYHADFPALASMKKWVRDTSTDNCITEVVQISESISRDTEVVDLLESALDPSTMIWDPEQRSPETQLNFATISEVSRSFTLNKLQHAAFRKMGSALLYRWKSREETEDANRCIEDKLRKGQLMFYLGGEGGTGKSRVIGAIEKLCISWKRKESLLKTALTGKDATLISGPKRCRTVEWR